MRRQFTLPDRDVRFLDSLGLPWETTRQANDLWVIVLNHPAPPGYDRPFTNIAIKIEAGYPDAQLDMAYSVRVSPAATESPSPIRVEHRAGRPELSAVVAASDGRAPLAPREDCLEPTWTSCAIGCAVSSNGDPR